LIDIPEDEDEKDSIKDSTLVTEEAPIEAKAEDIIDVKVSLLKTFIFHIPYL